LQLRQAWHEMVLVTKSYPPSYSAQKTEPIYTVNGFKTFKNKGFFTPITIKF